MPYHSMPSRFDCHLDALILFFSSHFTVNLLQSFRFFFLLRDPVWATIQLLNKRASHLSWKYFSGLGRQNDFSVLRSLGCTESSIHLLSFTVWYGLLEHVVLCFIQTWSCALWSNVSTLNTAKVDLWFVQTKLYKPLPWCHVLCVKVGNYPESPSKQTELV